MLLPKEANFKYRTLFVFCESNFQMFRQTEISAVLLNNLSYPCQRLRAYVIEVGMLLVQCSIILDYCLQLRQLAPGLALERRLIPVVLVLQ